MKRKIKKVFISFILFLIAVLATIIFLPLQLIEIPMSIIKIGTTKYFLNIAGTLDQLLNVLYKNTLDFLFIKNRQKAKAKFGYADEKISSMLGYIQEEKNLSFLGKQLCNFLNFLEKDHCIKSISNDKEIYVKK